MGSVVESQYLDMDNVTMNLRNFYTRAYLGVSSKKVPKFWLAFGVSLPPLGWNTYFISEKNGKGKFFLSSKIGEQFLSSQYSLFFCFFFSIPICFVCILGGINRSNVSVVEGVQNQVVDIGPGNLKLSFSSSGQLLKMFNSESGVRYLELLIRKLEL